MADHASALVLSLLRPVLRSEGVDDGLPPAHGDATVPFTRKRAIVSDLLERAGPLPLLGIADRIPALDAHPLSRVFASAESGSDLLNRWVRLERYFHSRHRTRVTFTSENEAVIDHLGPRGAPPVAAEDIVVAGIQLGLLRWIGAQDVRLCFLNADGDWPAFDAAGYHAPTQAVGFPTNRWRLAWSSVRPGATHRTPHVEPPAHAAIGRPLADPLVRRLFGAVMTDPSARLTLAERARHLGLSPRTLQRRLTHAGWSLREIVATARIEVAATMLAKEDTPIALVGLAAGFADQPHFQRAFTRRLGPTPAVYRAFTART